MLPIKFSVVLPLLPYFLSVVRHMSFTKAAEDLYLTQGAVSQRIKQLEEELGFALFHRYPRKIALTQEGKLLNEIVSDRLLDLQKEICRLDRNGEKGILTVHCSPSFAGIWLTPRLHDFYNLYSELSLHLLCRNDPINLEAEGIDVAVMYSVGPDPGTESIPLMDEWLMPVCSPEYARRKKLHGIEYGNLKDCLLLHDNKAWPHSDYFSEWEYWAKKSGVKHLNTNSGYSFDRLELTMIAAKSGLGVALGRKNLVQDDIMAGTLVAPFDGCVKSHLSYLIILRKEDIVHPRISIFVDWLKQQAEAAASEKDSMPFFSDTPEKNAVDTAFPAP